jgi:LmbE family N-acetylglucosaminyl deacetylase
MILATALIAMATAAFSGALLVWRRVRYLRLFNDDPARDCEAGFPGQLIETVSVPCGKDGLTLPYIEPNVTGAFLELSVRTTTAGAYFDPALEIGTSYFKDAQFIERGANGKRLFNITRLIRHATIKATLPSPDRSLGASYGAGRRVSLRGKRLNWKADTAKIHLSREAISGEDRVLVISPHPDDAEIAAFGLYTDTCAVIVTITAGNNSDRYRNSDNPMFGLPPAVVARMRVLDSISIPRLGGVPQENAINLCYPDGGLESMRIQRGMMISCSSESTSETMALRSLNSSRLVREGAESSWSSLVSDLVHILKLTNPTVIVTPHPRLDPHPDHISATLAVVEALKIKGVGDERYFLYCVHNRSSELWPFGPAGTGVSHPPSVWQDKLASGFYSHCLSRERLSEKYAALEAMHDIREMEAPKSPSIVNAVKAIRSEIRAAFDGLGRVPTSYLRRGTRPDETFFVVPAARLTFDCCPTTVTHDEV